MKLNEYGHKTFLYKQAGEKEIIFKIINKHLPITEIIELFPETVVATYFDHGTLYTITVEKS